MIISWDVFIDGQSIGIVPVDERFKLIQEKCPAALNEKGEMYAGSPHKIEFKMISRKS